MLWRNTNGSLIDWTMNGSQIASSQPVTLGGSPSMPDVELERRGIGDFNGDGKADILWRNTNGTLIDWTMNGSQIANAQQVTFGGSPVSLDSSWQIAQIGDFNGNGSSDILLRNTNGAMEEWSMNGAQIASASQVTLQGKPRDAAEHLEHAFKADRLHFLKRDTRNRAGIIAVATGSPAPIAGAQQSVRERACRKLAALSFGANLLGGHDDVTGDIVDDGLHHETKPQAAGLADRALAIARLREGKLPLVVDELYPVFGRAHGNCSRHPQYRALIS